MAKNEDSMANVAMLMEKVFGDRLNGLSPAEIAFVKDSMIANLDKVKAEAKERAAWADVLDGISDVLATHKKADVVKGKVLRLSFDDKGKVSTFKIQKVRTSTGTSTDGKVKQYRKVGSQKWETTGTWANACNALNFPINGNSAKRVLEGKGYETQIVDKV